jgi:hypothetical protein
VIEYEGETYLTAGDVAKRFQLSRRTCYQNLLSQVHACYLPGRKHAFYRQSDVEQFSEVRTVARQQGVFPTAK